MERLEIIEALKHLPDKVEAETAGVGEAVLRYRPGDAEWSIKEIVGHLRDSAEVWHKRIYTTASLTDPRFPAFDGEASVKEQFYWEADLRHMIDEMREWRMKTIAVLVHAVDWTRLGQHADIGRRTLKQWAEYMVEHEAAHIESIRALKLAQSARQPA
jgi:DinB superfamily